MTQRLNYQVVAAAGLRGLGSVHQYVANSGLPHTLVDLVYLRVSQINGCAYCIAMHTNDLLQAGVGMQKLMLLSAWREAGGLFSDRERAALQWAESVTLISQTAAADADYEAVAAQFSEKELVDLTLAISLMNTYNRLAISFRRGPDVPASE
jgi:AhpD family alkylhydroperoxidase